MDTVALPAGTLIWTPDAPRPVETLQAGETLTGFDGETFSRVPVTLRRVRVQEKTPVWRLQAGGRVVLLSEKQSLPCFTVSGEWGPRPVPAIRPGDLLPVDRLVPPPAYPVALPPVDATLTRLLDEDALALSDALVDSAAYRRKMDKRAQRLALYELTGYLCEAAIPAGSVLDVVLPGNDDLGYYSALCERAFGGESIFDPALLPRLQAWMGEGLAAPPFRALPSWVWRLPDPAVSAFLRGFFDSASLVTEAEVTFLYEGLRLTLGVQALLGRLHIEAAVDIVPGFGKLYRLTVRNVRRFAEWVNSNLPTHAGVLRAVYAREPRYPSETNARLPMNVVGPALERIRNRHALPRRTEDAPDGADATRLDTLRLLATAFGDSELSDAVNGLLYLEPVTANTPVTLDNLFILSLDSPATLVANGIVVGG